MSRPENRKDFAYHCAHIYYTFRNVAAAVFGSAGEEVAAEVLRCFTAAYGEPLAAVIAAYDGECFDWIYE